MKKQLLFLVLFMGLFSVANYAQDKKMFIGVDLSFAAPETHSHFAIAPSLGYWLADNMALVGGIQFSSDTPDKLGDPDHKLSTFGIGAELRYGWHHGDNTFFFWAPSVAFASASTKSAGVTSTGTVIGIGLSPGVDYHLGDRWTISAELGLLQFTSTSPDSGPSSSAFKVDLNMSALSWALWYRF